MPKSPDQNRESQRIKICAKGKLKKRVSINAGWYYMNWRAAKLPHGTIWRKVQNLLSLMGGTTWPERASFVPWLQDDVVALLRFVVHGEAIAGEPDIDATDTNDTEGLIPFDQMPPNVQDTVENALEIVPPEDREEMRGMILFDPKPSKRQYKKLAA